MIDVLDFAAERFDDVGDEVVRQRPRVGDAFHPPVDAGRLEDADHDGKARSPSTSLSAMTCCSWISLMMIRFNSIWTGTAASLSERRGRIGKTGTNRPALTPSRTLGIIAPGARNEGQGTVDAQRKRRRNRFFGRPALAFPRRLRYDEN